MAACLFAGVSALAFAQPGVLNKNKANTQKSSLSYKIIPISQNADSYEAKQIVIQNARAKREAKLLRDKRDQSQVVRSSPAPDVRLDY